MRPRIGELCAGYGGLGMAVQAVLGGELAWVADNDPGAAAILAHRFPSVLNHGDITVTDWAAVEPVDVLCAGFPCQPVSAAGRRKGITDERWLFDDICSAVGRMVTRPRLLVLENVPGLLSANGGDAMAHVVSGLAALGYVGRYRLLRASDAGAPHRRERWFCLAWPAADTANRRQQELASCTDRRERRTPRPDGARFSQRSGSGTGDRTGAGDNAARTAQDPDCPAGGEWRISAPGQAPGGWPRADAGRPSGAPAADTSGDGWHEGWPEPARLLRGPDAAERSDGPAADAQGDPGWLRHGDDVLPRRGADRCGTASGGSAPANADSAGLSRLTELHPPEAAGLDGEHRGHPDRRSDGPDWGPYEGAIRRWEAILGRPAPRPTEPGRTGERLSPRFVEWMQGLPEGWVTDVLGLSRNAQLKALGNGVVPQQAAMALRLLLAAIEQPGAAA